MINLLKSYIRNEISILVYLLRILTLILVPIAVVAFLSVQFQFFDLELSLSTIGVSNYFSKFGDHYFLFAGTIASIVALVGVLSLAYRVKQDKYHAWEKILDFRLNKIGEENLSIESVFKHIRFDFFYDLYRINFIIKDKKMLTNLFDKYFKKNIRYIEESEEKFTYTSCYPDDKYLYSFISFRYVFLGCLDMCGEKYTQSTLLSDLENMFNSELLPKEVNPELHNHGLNRYAMERAKKQYTPNNNQCPFS